MGRSGTHNGMLPSVTRVFQPRPPVVCVPQAYERTTTQMEPLVAFASFYREREKVFETAPVAVVRGMDARSKSVGVRLTIPLDQLEAGRYECQLTVLHPGARKVAFWRAPIVVIP